MIRETRRQEDNLTQRQVEESMRYWMEDGTFDRVTARGYVPTSEDMLRVRARTVGSPVYSKTVATPTIVLVDLDGKNAHEKNEKVDK